MTTARSATKWKIKPHDAIHRIPLALPNAAWRTVKVPERRLSRRKALAQRRGQAGGGTGTGGGTAGVGCELESAVAEASM